MQHIIIGDGVAGHTAAKTIREEDADADIHVFTTESYPFYDRIGLRAYIRKGRDLDALILNDTEWYEDNDIALHLDTEIMEIDREAQTVTTASGNSFAYDRLLMAVGGTPRTIPIEKGCSRVHHLWTVEEHGNPLRAHLEDAETGIVVGGGLLGFDLIGAFAQTDTDTTYLIREDRWWHSVLSKEGAAIIHTAMREHGVDLRLEEAADDFVEDGETVHVTTNKAEYAVDVVGIAIGHIRNLELADAAGLETNHGIVCDPSLQTNDPNIYVAGDVAEYEDPVLGKRNLGGSWITAQEQGEVAGKNMAGANKQLNFVDTYTVNHFGVNVASLGDPRSTEEHEVITAFDESGGRYRKLVLDNGRIVGAAIVGEMKWLYPLKQLILNKVDVSEKTEALANPETDLKELL